jgi:metal-sulfur cluster biosynthetic enzyme
MPEIEIDMSQVDQETAEDVADEILLYFDQLDDEGVAIIDMIVALGMVVEVLIEQSDREMANTRSH